MISTNNYICFVIIKTQQPGDCNLGPTISPLFDDNKTYELFLKKWEKWEKELGGSPSNHAIYMNFYIHE